jgi:dTDP-4-amino-4,6-dideoxygalactose transaminase
VTSYSVPFNRPCLTGSELRYVMEAVHSGHTSGDGVFTKRCHELLERELKVKKALLTTSCTHALEMAALLLGVAEGDEVIVPSFTFVSTANAFVLRGAKPVFADIRRDTLNIDETLLEGLITPRTKVIVVVHYAGVACEMDAILDLANSYGIDVVEDNAHGLFAAYKGRLLGTLGRLATQSFHETKNFTCGEGGALLINDSDLTARAEVIREKGTDRSRFFRGEVAKYSWIDIGSSYLPSDILAAFLYAQLEAREQVQAKRSHIWSHYYEQLQEWAAEHNVGLPYVPAHCEQPYHMFYLLMPDLESRSMLISHLKERGILSVFHYLPLHISDVGLRVGGKPGDCPVSEAVSERLVRLPFFNELSESEQARIVEAVRSFRPSTRARSLKA